MSYLTVSDSFIVGLQVVTNDPFRKLAQKGEGARTVYGDRLLLKNESVSDVSVVGIETKIHTETRHHT